MSEHRFCKDCTYCDVVRLTSGPTPRERWLCTHPDIRVPNPNYWLDGEPYDLEARRECLEAREKIELCGHGARLFEAKTE